MTDTQQNPDSKPWWAAFPAPKARTSAMPAEEVLALVESDAAGPRDHILVDVRRTDWEGGTVAGSVNLPAHTLYQTRAAVYGLCKRAGVSRVVFYCGSCSEGGRGWKCANWMQDYIDEQGDVEMKAFMLEGGIKGWVKRFGGRGVDGFEDACWQQSK